MNQSQSLAKNLWQGLISVFPGRMKALHRSDKLVDRADGRKSEPIIDKAAAKAALSADKTAASHARQEAEKQGSNDPGQDLANPFAITEKQRFSGHRSVKNVSVGRMHLQGDLFGMSHDMSVIDHVFEEQRRFFWQVLDQIQSDRSSVLDAIPGIYREFGKADGGRRYFYVKTFNERGWLFERSGIGWVMSRAEKITERNLFVRHGSAFDLVSIFTTKDHSRMRISSQRWSLDHLNADVYANKCLIAMGLLQ